MNTLQLTKDMLRNKYTRKYFRGVFPRDKLPKRIKRPALVIANTDASTDPGQHWVAFYIPDQGPCEYFDSIGEKPEKEDFLKFLKRCGKSYLFNSKRIQGTFSTTCGNYCALYLLYRSKKISKDKFMKLFNDNYSTNDIKIINLYKRNFRKYQIGANSIAYNQTCQPYP